jgi:hypothetical protein
MRRVLYTTTSKNAHTTHDAPLGGDGERRLLARWFSSLVRGLPRSGGVDELGSAGASPKVSSNVRRLGGLAGNVGLKTGGSLSHLSLQIEIDLVDGSVTSVRILLSMFRRMPFRMWLKLES